MKQFILILIVSVTIFQAHAQPHVYIVSNSPIEFACGVHNSGNQVLVTYGGNSCQDFSAALIDSNGFITANYLYGTGQALEFPIMSRQQDNGEILICGWNFWDSVSNANISNYKGYVMVIDTLGQFKRAFHVKAPTTYFNKVRNGIRLHDYYYFTGQHTDSSEVNPPVNRPFLCKTDTLGNLIWFKTYPQFNLNAFSDRTGLESSHNQTNVLLGANIIDSLVGNFYYTSYFLMKLDTAGNFISRIDLPKFSGNEQFTGINPIMEIKRISGGGYMIACNREWYLLDQNYNLLDSQNMAMVPYSAEFTHQDLYNASFLIGGNVGFGKIYMGNGVFDRDYSSLPSMASFVDVIPTYDGGYFAVTNNTNVSSTYMKMDCDGDFINSKICWPLAVNQAEEPEMQWHYALGMLQIQNPGNAKQWLRVHDVSGRLLRQEEIPTGFSSISLQGMASGIYLLRLGNDVKNSKTMKVWIEK